MGNLNSVLGSIVAGASRPTADNGSGLNYSGKVYMNQASLVSQQICGDQASVGYAAVNDIYPNGVATDTLPIDDSTKRISTTALQGYVENLKVQGIVPAQTNDITAQIAADKIFYANVQAEYCFYEGRYLAALTQFITEVSSRNGGTGNTALGKTITLNKKLNSLLEVIGYVGNDRARSVNDRSNMINQANNDINAKLDALKAQQAFLQSSDVRIQTEQEMMRYSKEKNSAMNIQVMFFVALNVVALGTVFTVYKGLRPGNAV